MEREQADGAEYHGKKAERKTDFSGLRTDGTEGGKGRSGMLFRIPEESLKFKKVDKQKKLFYTTPCSNFDKKVIDWMVFELDVTVQDGGKTGAKAGVKLAYKHVFAPVFTSEEQLPIS